MLTRDKFNSPSHPYGATKLLKPTPQGHLLPTFTGAGDAIGAATMERTTLSATSSIGTLLEPF